MSKRRKTTREKGNASIAFVNPTQGASLLNECTTRVGIRLCFMPFIVWEMNSTLPQAQKRAWISHFYNTSLVFISRVESCAKTLGLENCFLTRRRPFAPIDATSRAGYPDRDVCQGLFQITDLMNLVHRKIQKCH